MQRWAVALVAVLLPTCLWSRLQIDPALLEIGPIARSAQLIFRGQVVSVTPGAEPSFYATARFQVDRWYLRGSLPPEIKFSTMSFSGHNCIYLEPGTSWIVFAYEHLGHLMLDDDCYGALPISSRLAPLLDNAEFMAQAGARDFPTDASGSALALTDSSGTVQTQYSYEPFGKTTSTGQTNTSSFQYTGREQDGTGLYFDRARYYNPSLGRFISQYPLGFGGGDKDLYTYVCDNPIDWIDPFGRNAVVAYWPNDAFGYGHVGIGVNTDHTRGFYPTSRPWCLVTGCDVPRRVLNDPEDHPSVRPQVITIPTTSEQDRAMQNFMNQRLNHPGNYNLYGRNCARFVEDVLRAGGVPNVPNTSRPDDLIHNYMRDILAPTQH